MKWLIGITVLAIALTGCSIPTAYPPLTTTVPYTPPTWSHSVVTAAPALPVKHYLDDTVYNGSLRFTVNSTRRETRVNDQFGGSYGATGREYVIVKVSVWNTAAQPIFFYYGSQTLNLHGQQVSIDNGPTGALNPMVTPIIQPGMGIPVYLAFLVPNGEQPEAIMLSDALASIADPTVAATRVELARP